MRNPYAPPDPAAPPPVRRRPEHGHPGENGGPEASGEQAGPGEHVSGEHGSGNGQGGWQDPHSHDPRRPLHPHGRDPQGHGPRDPRDPRTQWQRPERPAPTPEQAAAAGRSVLKFGAALLVAMLAMRWPIPWQLFAPVAGAVAVYLGIRALITYRKVGMTTFSSVFLMFGVGIAAVLSLSSLTLLTMWDAQVAHQECMDRALTVQAEQACTDAYEQAMQERLNPSGG